MTVVSRSNGPDLWATALEPNAAADRCTSELSISLDELAIGIGVGLVRLPLLPLVVLDCCPVRGAPGARLAEKTRESAEKIAGLLLVVTAVLIVLEKELGP